MPNLKSPPPKKDCGSLLAIIIVVVIAVVTVISTAGLAYFHGRLGAGSFAGIGASLGATGAAATLINFAVAGFVI